MKINKLELDEHSLVLQGERLGLNFSGSTTQTAYEPKWEDLIGNECLMRAYIDETKLKISSFR